MGRKNGNVSGFIFAAEDELTVYWMGDTIWYDEVQKIVQETNPDIIITHLSGAKFGDSDSIVMNAEMTTDVCQFAPQTTVIAVHLESLDHGTVTHQALRELVEEKGISTTRLIISTDGEILKFEIL